MPQYRATKTFGTDKSKYGLIRTGMVVTMPEADASKYNRANPGVLVEYTGPFVPQGEPEADEREGDDDNQKARENAPDNKAHEAPPRNKDAVAEDSHMGNDETEDDEQTPPAAGRGIRSSALRRGRHSKKKTSRR